MYYNRYNGTVTNTVLIFKFFFLIQTFVSVLKSLVSVNLPHFCQYPKMHKKPVLYASQQDGKSSGNSYSVFLYQFQNCSKIVLVLIF